MQHAVHTQPAVLTVLHCVSCKQTVHGKCRIPLVDYKHYIISSTDSTGSYSEIWQTNFSHIQHSVIPPLGDQLVMAVVLMGSEDPLFRNRKGRRLLRVRKFGPQNPAYGGAKISRDPVQSMCLQGVLVVPLLVIILRS